MGVSLQQYRVTIGAHAGRLWRKTPATRSKSKTSRRSRRCRKMGLWQIMFMTSLKVTSSIAVLLMWLSIFQQAWEVTWEVENIMISGSENYTILVPKSQLVNNVLPIVNLFDSSRLLLLCNDVETNPGPHSAEFENSLCEGLSSCSYRCCKECSSCVESY